MTEYDPVVSEAARIYKILLDGADGYLSNSWVRDSEDACDLLVAIGVCKYTKPVVGGIRIELTRPVCEAKA